MSTAFYNRMKGTATRLLTKYGKAAVIEDISMNKLGEVMLVEGDANTDNIPQSVIERTEKIVYCDSEGVRPDVDMYITFDNQFYKIIYIKEYSPSSLTLLYQLFLTK